MVASGAHPVLAGRDQSRLSALAARLSQAGDGTELETAVAAAEGPGPLRDLIGVGDVRVSTAGPFMKVGRPVVAAAVDAGAVYLDSSGEPPFIRQVFEEFGPRRTNRCGAADRVRLRLRAGKPGRGSRAPGRRTRRSAGTGRLLRPRGHPAGTSAGTRASVTGVLLEPGYAFRGGRIVSERTAAHVTSFNIDGKKMEALSIGPSEHFALPRLRPTAGPDGIPPQVPLTDVGV
jgi:hypothetical protein